MLRSELPISSRLTALHDYWLTKCPPVGLPSRSDIDPGDIREILPVVFLVDIQEPLKFRLRLVGTEIVAKFGRDLTGEPAHALVAESGRNDDDSEYEHCVNERLPLISRRQVVCGSGVFWRYERILLPLAAETGDITMLLGGIDIRVPLSELHKLEKQACLSKLSIVSSKRWWNRPSGGFQPRPMFA